MDTAASIDGSRIVPKAILDPVREKVKNFPQFAIWGGVSVAMGALVLWGIGILAGAQSPSFDAAAPTAQGMFIAALVGAAVVGLASIWFAKLRPVFVTFLAFLFFNVTLYLAFPDSPLFHGAGLYHLAMYVVAMAILMAVGELPEGKRGTAYALTIASFCVLGVGTFFYMKTMRDTSTISSSVAPSIRVTGCSGESVGPYTLGLDGEPVTDGRRCQALIDVLSGEARLLGPGGYMDIGPSGVIRNATSPGWRAVTMVALTRRTQVQKRLCPEGTTRWNGERCV